MAATALMVLVIALGLFTACTDETLVEYEVPAVSTAATTTSSSQTYTLTVQASKGEAVTRALVLNDPDTEQESLDAVWMTTDTIYVYKGETKVGELKPQEDNVAQTLLKGEVSNVALNDVLTLEFLSPAYATQDGTLAYIAANCDYATASVKVLEINGTEVTTTGAAFENQQSIVKFTLQDKDNSNAAISATEMIVTADGRTYSIQPTAATSEMFVALPSFTEKAIRVTAVNDTDVYTFVRESITIESGRYYTLAMQMAKGNQVDLSTLTDHYVAQDGDILTGATDSSYKISVADGAHIILRDASINAGGAVSRATEWAGITCLGDATITLVGDNNVVNACCDFFPGIQAGPANTTLTIGGTGSLKAQGYREGPGIGIGYNETCGNITIDGGNITATGGLYAVGIGSGSGRFGTCGNITITDGTITATGGDGGAGIGTGCAGNCGNISISGGTIIATGGDDAAGIGTGGMGMFLGMGSGYEGDCGDISIIGGTIIATGGDDAAGIGSGSNGSCGNITIGGTAQGTAKGGEGSPMDIGYGVDSACGTVIVQDNTISGRHPINLSMLTGDYVAQDGDILTGAIDNSIKISIAASANITLIYASINAEGIRSGNTPWAGLTCLGDATITLLGKNEVNGCCSGYPGIQAGGENTTLTIGGTGSLKVWAEHGAGIGSGDNDVCGDITITGGSITVKVIGTTAGIGSGIGGVCGNITITGGTINVDGTQESACIGSTLDGTCGDITITGGSINVTGDVRGAGIGGGSRNTVCGNITITGGSIIATGGMDAAGIGSGGFYETAAGSCGDITISGGNITATGGNNAAGIGSGTGGSCGKITIGGTATGTATGGENSPYDIGPGLNGTVSGLVILEDNTISGSCYRKLVDLSTLTQDYVAQDNDVLTGAIGNTYKISVAAGASIMLSDAHINASGADSDATPWAGITCLGEAHITLLGENVVNSCSAGFPGIQAGPALSTLTIDGTGSLRVSGGSSAAGIGSGINGSCGNISIIGGFITATGGDNAAGIGGGEGGRCGKITIGGTASGTAKGGEGSPYDIGPGKGGTASGYPAVQPNTISGRCYENTVNLSTLSGSYVAQDGDVLTGTIDNSIKISIADGASITLKDVYINESGNTSTTTNWAGITCQGDATITLVGTNVVKGCYDKRPGIQASGKSGGRLTIGGTGSLSATGCNGAAGIGGSATAGCSNITITGGTITATGGDDAAGIGSGTGKGCGYIRISGGTINATGGSRAAGIGSGSGGRCGAVIISGTASGTAKGGENSPYDIGPGDGGTCVIVSVQPNTISGTYSAINLSALTDDYEAQDGDILTGTIDNRYKISIAAGASITLKGVSINAGGANSAATNWAGLTCLGDATITLVGTNVVRGSYTEFPGIQAGPENTTLTISGSGSLTATGGTDAAGIGSGQKGTCGDITISGGTITATGGYGAAGIGSGNCGSCGNIKISGTASGTAKGGANSPWDIGSGDGGTCGTVSVQDNTISGSYPN